MHGGEWGEGGLIGDADRKESPIDAVFLDAIGASLGLAARVTHDLSRAKLGCCHVQVLRGEQGDVRCQPELSCHCGDHNLFIHICGHVLLMPVRIFNLESRVSPCS